MALYESIFVVRTTLSDEDTNKLIEKMKSVLEKAGAQLLKLENWGKKKLAYEVKRERKGTFVYFHFKSAGGVVNELERSYRLEDSILKFLTVKQDLGAANKPAPSRSPSTNSVYGMPAQAKPGATGKALGNTQQSLRFFMVDSRLTETTKRPAVATDAPDRAPWAMAFHPRSARIGWSSASPSASWTRMKSACRRVLRHVQTVGFDGQPIRQES